MLNPIIPTLPAIGLSFLGLCLVYRGWKRADGTSSVLGWAIAASSALAWVHAAGLQYGLVYTLFVPALLVWPLVSLEVSRIAPRPVAPHPREALRWSGVKLAENVGKALVVALGLPLLAGVSTVFVSFQLPVERANQAAVAIVLLPLLTGLFVTVYLASARRRWWLLAGSVGTAALAAVMYL